MVNVFIEGILKTIPRPAGKAKFDIRWESQIFKNVNQVEMVPFVLIQTIDEAIFLANGGLGFQQFKRRRETLEAPGRRDVTPS